MSYLTVSDGQLFYTDEGTGGETVLFVHGGTCDSHDWAPQIEPFAARHRVITPDLRGHGRSSSFAGGLTPRDFAADLVSLLEHLDSGPVVVVGHSLGAAVASVLGVEFPDLVRAVVAVDPAYGFDLDFAAGVAAAFRTPDPVAVAAAVLAGMEAPATDPGLDWLPTWHRRRTLGTSPETAAAVFQGLFDAPNEVTLRPAAEGYLRRRTCPVLTVSANASLKAKGIDLGWEEAVSLHPYSSAVAWDGVGHWIHQERAAEFNELVLDWIAGLPASPAEGAN
ncbi:alpha/beta fold hydrolase [Nonomuraea jiangxiensis]|uniref:Pimeloyl-ACP methyl ester carboxylesterase n=1 Tax=Nonomuraea jiangxiensis TaxID=633440 RepID=A0A1G8M6J1_9ACTN|nr:alpha/beta hydrolase [Nonomuraea jiangxiensis]SDI63558.1 Pimeloyl-ACP methyl ester carboxylesterase [Nonomuraea jiangxiensis]